MSWSDRYIGIPFKEGGRDFKGCDCGGLVLLALRHEKGILATDFKAYEQADFKSRAGYDRLGAGIETLMQEWVVVEKPEPFDLLRFWYGPSPCHVGIYVGRNMFLHVEKSLVYSNLASQDDLCWGHRFYEYRRHKLLI